VSGASLCVVACCWNGSGSRNSDACCLFVHEVTTGDPDMCGACCRGQVVEVGGAMLSDPCAVPALSAARVAAAAVEAASQAVALEALAAVVALRVTEVRTKAAMETRTNP